MGFWYFLLLGLGIILIVRGIASRAKQGGLILVGLVMVGVSIFMFQDGSADLVANWFDQITGR
ncbi:MULTISPECIES: hypothetical protein [unclassified Exiguobacterium]|uniref:hypothetical protein n=1 Tax=unclassified Exiguobacterium TaxID=2644629 RepID=UPI001BEB34C7|nr:MULTISPECIES: hypothetical protein [unclassified Exiguobacterium]